MVAISETERALLVGECKWSSAPVGSNILADLQQKTRQLPDKQPFTTISYYLFAKSGFTPDLEAQADSKGVHLANLEELLG